MQKLFIAKRVVRKLRHSMQTFYTLLALDGGASSPSATGFDWKIVWYSSTELLPEWLVVLRAAKKVQQWQLEQRTRVCRHCFTLYLFLRFHRLALAPALWWIINTGYTQILQKLRKFLEELKMTCLGVFYWLQRLKIVHVPCGQESRLSSMMGTGIGSTIDVIGVIPTCSTAECPCGEIIVKFHEAKLVLLPNNFFSLLIL